MDIQFVVQVVSLGLNLCLLPMLKELERIRTRLTVMETKFDIHEKHFIKDEHK